MLPVGTVGARAQESHAKPALGAVFGHQWISLELGFHGMTSLGQGAFITPSPITPAKIARALPSGLSPWALQKSRNSSRPYVTIFTSAPPNRIASTFRFTIRTYSS